MDEISVEHSRHRYFKRRRIFIALALSLISGIVSISIFGSPEVLRLDANQDTVVEKLYRFRRSIGNISDEQEKSQRRLPRAIIIGVKKGGTRALLEYLRMHPDIKAPGPEVHFFDRHYHLGADWYRRQMPPTSIGQVAIEKTPSYFVTKEAPGRLKSFGQDVKLIIVLRNPVTRALSDYAQNAAKRSSMLDFEELAFINMTKIKNDCVHFSNSSRNCHRIDDVLDNDLNLKVNISWGAIRIGLYHRYVKRWLKYFDLKRVHFVSGEHLVTNPAKETNSVERFLGLRRSIDEDDFVYPNSTVSSMIDGKKSNVRFPCLKSKSHGKSPRCLGKTKGRRHPKVDEKLLRILNDFYRPHNELLYKLIGRKFDW